MCRIFIDALLRSRFTLWIFLGSKVRKANNELLIHEQKRKVGRGKFFLDWMLVTCGIRLSVYFFLSIFLSLFVMFFSPTS